MLIKARRSLKSQRRVQKDPNQQFHESDSHNFICGIYTALLADAYESLPLYNSADYTRDVATVKRRLQNEGIRFATKTMPAIASGLLLMLETGRSTFSGFKTRNNVPIFLRGMFNVVRCESCTDELKTEYIKYIYQLGSAFKKLAGPISKDAVESMWNDFRAVDLDLHNVDLFEDKEVHEIMQLARHYCRAFADDITLDPGGEFIPRPGPGATATKRSHDMRYEPRVIFRQHDKVLPYYDWWYSHPWDVVCVARNYLRLKTYDTPSAQYIVVPKTYEKGRGICSEENETQFLQQGLSRGIRSAIATKLGKYLPLTDQTVNGQLALNASLDKLRATIDMSEASDRVLRDLVSWIFQDNIELHDALMALSTRVILPPRGLKSEPLHTVKYAPMGSALCFPIMSLVHYFLCTAIIRRKGSASGLRFKDVYVYGDDIICHSVDAEILYEWLPKFGMKLNSTKSYYRSYFRESCGIHAYKGKEITPVYFRSIPIVGRLDTQVSACSTEEQLYNKGYYRTSSTMRSTLGRSKIGQRVPKSSGLLGIRRGPYDVITPDICDIKTSSKRRYNWDLQCYEYRVRTVFKDVLKLHIDEPTSALLRWMGSNTEESNTVLTSDTKDLRLRWRWVPESAITEALAS